MGGGRVGSDVREGFSREVTFGQDPKDNEKREDNSRQREHEPKWQKEA